VAFSENNFTIILQNYIIPRALQERSKTGRAYSAVSSVAKRLKRPLEAFGYIRYVFFASLKA
jgi:hypothetical protein